MILDILVLTSIIVLLLGMNALYVAGEFAAVSVRRFQIAQLAEEGNRFARQLLPVISDPERLDNFIAACQVGITISSIVLGIYGQRQIAPRIAPYLNFLPFPGEQLAAAGLSAIVVLFVLTTFQVVLGELVPKSVALRYPERMALLTILPVRWSGDYLFRPLIAILNGSGNFLLNLFGIEAEGGHRHVHSPEEIEIIVSESHAGGLLDADERRLLHNAFRIGELSAGEIMVPRNHLVTASVELSIPELLRVAAESAYTRIPICEGDTDHIIGFVHLKDLFRAYRKDPQTDLRDVLRVPPYVPETTDAIEVWKLLNEKQCYLAIVFDEFGGVAGMITQEDLIEELFGELQDEFDQEQELVSTGGNGRMVVRGDLLINQLNDLLEVDLPTEAANTVGGLVLDELGRVPTVGDRVEIENIGFQVEAVAGRSIREVSLELPPEVKARVDDVDDNEEEV